MDTDITRALDALKRKHKRWSEVASRLGVTTQTLRNWRAGDALPSGAALRLLALLSQRLEADDDA